MELAHARIDLAWWGQWARFDGTKRCCNRLLIIVINQFGIGTAAREHIAKSLGRWHCPGASSGVTGDAVDAFGLRRHACTSDRQFGFNAAVVLRHMADYRSLGQGAISWSGRIDLTPGAVCKVAAVPLGVSMVTAPLIHHRSTTLPWIAARARSKPGTFSSNCLR
jgi:hypothetical protein